MGLPEDSNVFLLYEISHSTMGLCAMNTTYNTCIHCCAAAARLVRIVVLGTAIQ